METNEILSKVQGKLLQLNILINQGVSDREIIYQVSRIFDFIEENREE